MPKPRLGALLWIACLQYFLAEAVTASAWGGGYSVSHNYISDLGALACDAGLCSPWHAVMNASFVTQGCLMIGGAALLRASFGGGFWARAALILTGTAGLGVIGVGLAPEDFAPGAHYLSAGINIFSANAAMLCMGMALRGARPHWLGALGLIFGALGMAAFAILAAKFQVGLGVGIVERAAADSFALWLALLGGLTQRNGRLRDQWAPLPEA